MVGAVNPGLAAAIGSSASVLWLGVPSSWVYWTTWWFGDALGVMIIAPFVLAWFGTPAPEWRRRDWIECSALLVTIALVAHWTFTDATPAVSVRRLLPFLLFPLSMWAAFRFDLRIIDAASIVLDVVAAFHTARGRGLFALLGTSPIERLLSLQIYLSSVT